MTKVKRMFVCLCGFEFIPRSISLKGDPGRIYLSEPVCAYLFDTEEGWVLFDTGLNRDIITDPELEDRYFTSRGWVPTPICDEQHDLCNQLTQVGVSMADIRYVVLSHLHADHTGNLKKCTNARVLVQRAEYDFGFAAETPPPWFDIDYQGAGIDWQIIEGDYLLMDGLEIIDTKGHTPGHQSLVATLEKSGAMVLTADAGDLFENFEMEVACGENIKDETAVASICRLKNIAEERKGTLFLGHEIEWVKKIKLIPQYYD